VTAKGSVLINEWLALLDKVVDEVEDTVRAARRRVAVYLDALAGHLDLGDGIVLESLLRIVKAYLCSRALGSCVRYIDNVNIVHTEETPAVEVTLVIPGKT